MQPSTQLPSYPRPMRRHESFFSANGSPIANPFEVPDGGGDMLVEEDEEDEDEPMKNAKGGIKVMKYPSMPTFSFPSTSTSRASSSQPTNTSSQPHLQPRPLGHTRSVSQALINIPTDSGHVVQFDPVSTMPGDIDAMEGISRSAKKRAKEEVGRLARQMMERWTLGDGV